MKTICEAIAKRLLIQFYYSGDKVPGVRVVEPHMVAYNRRDNLAFSTGPRPGYKPDGGKTFHNVQCAL